MKLLVSGIGTFIAAVGGGLLALNYGYALPTTYATFAGLVWLAVFVTVGLRSISAAIIAGVTFTLLPGIFAAYLPVTWGNIPNLLFGLGAIAVVRNPDGQLAANMRTTERLALRLIGRWISGEPEGRAAAEPAAAEVLETRI
jgi:branched-chain amino acid transport system permease protein